MAKLNACNLGYVIVILMFAITSIVMNYMVDERAYTEETVLTIVKEVLTVITGFTAALLGYVMLRRIRGKKSAGVMEIGLITIGLILALSTIGYTIAEASLGQLTENSEDTKIYGGIVMLSAIALMAFSSLFV